jgi:hypothetical protein
MATKNAIKKLQSQPAKEPEENKNPIRTTIPDNRYLVADPKQLPEALEEKVETLFVEIVIGDEKYRIELNKTSDPVDEAKKFVRWHNNCFGDNTISAKGRIR